jgi:hypothetical protein
VCVAVAVALLTDIGRQASFVRAVVVDTHLVTATTTDHEPLQEGGPFARDATAALAIPILS